MACAAAALGCLGRTACRCRPASGCHAAVADGDPGPIRTGDLPLRRGRSIQLSYGAIGSGEGYLVWLNGPSAGRSAQRPDSICWPAATRCELDVRRLANPLRPWRQPLAAADGPGAAVHPPRADTRLKWRWLLALAVTAGITLASKLAFMGWGLASRACTSPASPGMRRCPASSTQLLECCSLAPAGALGRSARSSVCCWPPPLPGHESRCMHIACRKSLPAGTWAELQHIGTVRRITHRSPACDGCFRCRSCGDSPTLYPTRPSYPSARDRTGEVHLRQV